MMKVKPWVFDENLTFEPVGEVISVTIQIKATEEYVLVVLFIMLYEVVLTFESVDEMLWYNHLNKSYWTVLSNTVIITSILVFQYFTNTIWPLVRIKVLLLTF